VQDYDKLSMNTIVVIAFIIRADRLYVLRASNVTRRKTHVNMFRAYE
jgi:hypothetical protein